MATGFFYHPDFLKHDTGPGHPERAERLVTINDCLEKVGARRAVPLQKYTDFCEASLEQLLRVHDVDYLNFLAKTEGRNFFALDPDTTGCKESWRAAKLAAGAVIHAVEEMHKGNLKNAFCAVRPPGHHAEKDRAMGFCLLNNTAVAAAHLIEALG
ncbi:MAG: histone deacetylase family protein, partial [candidate division Zixibacteria bacterium]|nr:histone deacetylase family protein [candidate division Zixibacteria bacterium]